MGGGTLTRGSSFLATSGLCGRIPLGFLGVSARKDAGKVQALVAAPHTSTKNEYYARSTTPECSSPPQVFFLTPFERCLTVSNAYFEKMNSPINPNVKKKKFEKQLVGVVFLIYYS